LIKTQRPKNVKKSTVHWHNI